MPFSPTITRDSKSIPGVNFTIHRMGYARRVQLDFDTLSLRQRLRELEIENPPDTPREKELREQLDIARKKALAVSEDQQDEVVRQDIAPLVQQLSDAADAETRKRRAVLNEEYATVEQKIREHWIRSSFVSITGGELDGMTADQLLDYGPPALIAEMLAALGEDGRLSSEESKNFGPRGISGAAVPAATTNTTAAAAENPDGMPSATASAISQAA